jgi:putative flippase GtrA
MIFTYGGIIYDIEFDHIHFKKNSSKIKILRGANNMLNYFSKKHIYQICKYCISNGIATVIDFGLFALIIAGIHLNYLLANAISMSCGIVVGYYLQKNWAFQYQNYRNFFIFGKYILAVGIYFILTYLILIICVSYFLLNPILSKIIQISITFIWGYYFNSKFVFKK